MKVLALILFFLPMMGFANGVGNGGDHLRMMFEDGRQDAVARTEKLRRCSLPSTYKQSVVDWILNNKPRLLSEINLPSHDWTTENQATCAFTRTVGGAAIQLSFDKCRNIQTKQDAGRLLVHEAVHHFGIADESFADQVAEAVYLAVSTPTCAAPEEDPFEELSCRGSSVQLNDVKPLLSASDALTDIGAFKIYPRFRRCKILGGCEAWIQGNNRSLPMMGLSWNDGSAVTEQQLAGRIFLVNNDSDVSFAVVSDASKPARESFRSMVSNSLDEKGFSKPSRPDFKAKFGIDGPTPASVKYLTSRYSVDYEAGRFDGTQITKECLRSSWKWSTQKLNPISYSELEVVLYGRLQL